MGLNTNSEVRGTFLSINNGKLVKRVADGTENSVIREIEYEGVKKHISELRYSSLDANIIGIEIKEGEKFGDSLIINMEDGGEHFAISLSMAGRESKYFMMSLPNIDLTKKVRLNPYNYIKKGATKATIGLGIQQQQGNEWKNVEWFYNATNGLPQVPDGTDKDDFKIIMAQVTSFLKKKTKAYIAAAKFMEAKAAAPVVSDEPTVIHDEENPDNLPF